MVSETQTPEACLVTEAADFFLGLGESRRVMIVVTDGKSLTVKRNKGYPLEDGLEALAERMLHDAGRNKKPVLVLDTQKDPKYRRTEYIERDSPLSALILPVEVGSATWLFYADNDRKTGAFSYSELNEAKRFVDEWTARLQGQTKTSRSLLLPLLLIFSFVVLFGVAFWVYS